MRPCAQALRALDLPEKLNPPRRMLSRISARKNSGARPGGRRRRLGGRADRWPASPSATARSCSAAHALDFDDLLLRAVAAAGRQRGVRESYRRRFRYVLVDEYQDTNRAQYELDAPARRAPQATSPSWATRTSRSTPGAAPTSRTSSTSSTTFPARACCAWRRTTARARASSTLPRGSSPTTSKRKGKTLRAVKAAGDAGAAPPGRRRVPGGGLGGRPDRRPRGRGGRAPCSSA